MFSIIPRDTAFFALFEQIADVTVAAAGSYRHLLAGEADRQAEIERIRQFEHEGDAVVRRALEKLDRTFVTPFDREDIQSLVNLLDDVIDNIDAAAKRVGLYRVPRAPTWLVKQSEVLLEASRALGEAVRKLRRLKKPEALRADLRAIHRLENVGDENHHAAIAELYETTADPILVMKWKEIYDLTEAAIDGCEDVANVIEALVLKGA